MQNNGNLNLRHVIRFHAMTLYLFVGKLHLLKHIQHCYYHYPAAALAQCALSFSGLCGMSRPLVDLWLVDVEETAKKDTIPIEVPTCKPLIQTHFDSAYKCLQVPTSKIFAVFDGAICLLLFCSVAFCSYMFLLVTDTSCG